MKSLTTDEYKNGTVQNLNLNNDRKIGKKNLEIKFSVVIWQTYGGQYVYARMAERVTETVTERGLVPFVQWESGKTRKLRSSKQNGFCRKRPTEMTLVDAVVLYDNNSRQK